MEKAATPWSKGGASGPQASEELPGGLKYSLSAQGMATRIHCRAAAGNLLGSPD